MSTQEVEQEHTCSWDDTIKLYELYRDYVKHEDGLINHRVGWFIQLHSFLIASYGIVFAALISTFFDDNAGGAFAADPRRVACWLLVALAGIGILSSLSAAVSIYAAHRAIDTLDSSWNKKFKDVKYLPKLIGGGDVKNNTSGSLFHLGLPVSLALLWAASILVPVSFHNMKGPGADQTVNAVPVTPVTVKFEATLPAASTSTVSDGPATGTVANAADTPSPR